MKIPKNPLSMIIAGTIASGLSGLLLWPRATAFGFCLALTILLTRQKKWTVLPFMPGIALGVILGFFPIEIFDMSPYPAAFRYDYVTLISCPVFMTAYAYAYVLPKSPRSRSKWMLRAGCLTSILRSVALLRFSEILIGSLYNFFIGALPFVLAWQVAMLLTDPNYKKAPTQSVN